MPAIPPDDFLKPQKPKRQIKSKKYTDYISKNLVDRHSVNNNRCFVIENCKIEQLKHSFFVRTVVEWNHLDTELVHAETVLDLAPFLHLTTFKIDNYLQYSKDREPFVGI